MTARSSIANRAAVAAVALATMVGASCTSDTDAPADEPTAPTTAPIATPTSPAATTAPTDSVPSTGLVSIDGPATVDSGFRAADPGDGGG